LLNCGSGLWRSLMTSTDQANCRRRRSQTHDRRGTKLTAVDFAGMEEPSLRSLERVCRAQAALTTHEATKRALKMMAEEYRRLADLQDHPQQAQEQ
jgi:hypothetical protein